MRRLVGRRVVEERADMANLVIVDRGWGRRDEFYSEGDIRCSIVNGGVLWITVIDKDQITQYSPRSWRRCRSRMVRSRAKI